MKQIEAAEAFSFRSEHRQEGGMTHRKAKIYQINLTTSVFKLYSRSEIK